MKIAILAPLRFPISEPFHGGLEMHTHLLARELVAVGHEVTLFADAESDEQFNIVPIQLGETAGFGAAVFAYRRAMALVRRGDFDVIHNNSIHFLPPLLSGNLGFPMITTLHTPPYKSLRIAGRVTPKNNHTFVSISQHLKEIWKPFIGDHPVIHNGLDMEQWPLSLSAVAGTAVWYGRFTPEKGAEYAIQAARLAGYKLTLAGPVYDQDYFDREILPELDGRITYAGHLTQAELAALVGRSAVGLATSVWDEPFGLVYLEIPACGTPVAAFDSGAAKEIITAETGAIVPKYDVGALAQVLGKLEGRHRAGCRASVAEKFPVERMVAEYLRLYA
ncbi:MAG: glycosyltransferase involved in cell wall biosynthesis [Neolewinella sp.]|jgi:glycosyltransferase involved in cell wall biosynthesis